MNLESRKSIIASIEQSLSTKIICYLTGDRPGMQTQIGSDAILRFRRHLEEIGEVESISILLYSRGGDTNVPWRLVNLIREYCKVLNILVPYCAHSAATLICLGADKLIMGKMGELSPIDPSVANPFNPQDPKNPMAKVPISVEDVNAFKDLARRFGVKSESSDGNAQVFLELAKSVSPLALGNVERSYNQIRKLAASMIKLHNQEFGTIEETVEQKIVSTLTEQLFSHLHMINRREARELGLNVEYADVELDRKLWALYLDYVSEMHLNEPFNAEQDLGSNSSLRIELKRAYIESIPFTDVFVSAGIIRRLSQGPVQLPPGMQMPPNLIGQIPITVQMEKEGWIVER